MTQHECDEFWADAYVSHRAAGRSLDTAIRLADEDLENWLEGYVC